ncbi:hypothetical protein [Clostridium sp.]|uniref:hypothetical protein n=1 Tax=Clostridium sp. TaxID=1506 RepID=UPI0032170B84
MNNNVIKQMKKSIGENNAPEIKATLVNSLLWNEDKETIDSLEEMVMKSNIFEEDNNQELKKNENESLGAYIDRVSTALMLNYSFKKYEILKELYKDYHLENMKKKPEVTYTINSTSDSNEENYNLKDISNDEKMKKNAIIAGCVAVGVIGLLLINRNKNKRKK